MSKPSPKPTVKSSSLDELRAIRLAKLELLKKAGIEPYPASVPRDFCLADARASFAEYAEVVAGSPAGKKAGTPVSLAGRVMALRGQGAILFAVLDDGKATFQAVIKKDVLNSLDTSTTENASKNFDFFTSVVDIGDIISVTGTFFTTQRGEPSILVTSWTMASKSLLPLPEKWHGLQDPDEKLRKRYLDFIMDPETRDIFYKKAKFWDTARQFMKENGFLEVETPTLETTTGGAEARPFSTHHNDYDIDVYLRISVGELWQKRLIAAGFPRTFEIGRLYRNEGSSPEHAQEFTNLEFYASYFSFEQGVAFTEKLIKKVAEETFGTLSFDIKGQKVDLSIEWPRIDYVDTVKKMTDIDVLNASEKDMIDALKKLKVTFDGMNRERLMDTLWKYCRKQIVGPVWLTGHPKLVSPLSKADPARPETTLRAQLILAGAEMTNGFAELNDAPDQRARFEVQSKLIEKGDDEAMMPDWEFVEMLEHAMPPAFGFGYGDRLFSTLAGKPLRETQLFPLMKPKGE
jgi:lysyl-tRNA synthetase class 2